MFQSSSTTEAVLDVLVAPASGVDGMFQSSSTTEAVLDPHCGRLVHLAAGVSILEHDRSRARRATRPDQDILPWTVSILEHDRSRARPCTDVQTEGGPQFQSSSTTEAVLDTMPTANAIPTAMFQSSSTTEAVLDERKHQEKRTS